MENRSAACDELKCREMIRNSFCNKKVAIFKGSYFLFVICLVSSIFAVDSGHAQEPLPTTTVEETPTATSEVLETETTTPESEAEQPHLSGELSRLLVTISRRARMSSVTDSANTFGDVIEIDELSKLGVFIIEVPLELVDERLSQIQNMSGVSSVEPDYPVWATDTIPNDPGLGSQYALAAIRAPQGWDISTGSSAVTIAILDSGVDLGHADLAGKLTAGYDFANSDSIPQDDYGHGTHVAGIAAASGNNGMGIAGVSWGAQIMPVKVLNSSGGGTYANVAAGIVWAVDNGAQVINMSLGGGSPSVVLQNAVLYASANNVLLVASSGNTGSSFVLYPARYSGVMAVGASNAINQPWSSSNYGPELDVAAPGQSIYSLWPGGYATQSGTSMSAPHVSGLAAILYGYVNNASVVRNAIESTALDIGPAGWDLYSGAGLIQMDSAIALLVPPTATPTSTVTTTATFTSTPIPLVGSGGVLLPSGSLSTISTTRTWTPPATPAPASVTLADSLTTPGATHELEIITLNTSTPTPQRENKFERLKVFLSPYFCGAFLLIFFGVWLLKWGRDQKRKKYNNFVK